ncbi:MAG: hypothetical protein N2508_05045 [Anaerolineae bacterium]|nr:hypothetical protein [Anaerolineae bacterium]
MEIAGLVIGVVLTLAIFTYLVGDNSFYRLALYLFIGVLVGYSLGIALHDVVYKMALAKIFANPLSNEARAVLFPLVLGIMLLFKGFPRYAYVGRFPLAYLLGVGTAVAVGGALVGTLVPQIGATGQALRTLGPLDGLLVVAGTILALLTFTFRTGQARQEPPGMRERIAKTLRATGQLFLLFAFGAAFAGALTASLSALIGRIRYLVEAADKLWLFISPYLGW